MRSRRRITILFLVGLAAVGAVATVISWQERHLHQIEQQLAAGDVAGALAATEQFLAARPDHSPAIALRARALLAAGQFQESVQLFEQIGAAEPADLRAWSLGLIYTDQAPKALPILEQLLKQGPDDGETLEYLTICHAELRHYASAAECAKRLAQLADHEAKGHLLLASIYQDWGFPSLAKEQFERVLASHPDATGLPLEPAEFFLSYGKSLLASGNPRRAQVYLERSRQLHSSWDVIRLQAHAALQVGDVARAQEWFEQLLRQDVHDQDAREQLAEIALGKEDAVSAEKWLRPLIERDAVSSYGAFLLQRAFTALENETEAQMWQEKARLLRAKR